MTQISFPVKYILLGMKNIWTDTRSLSPVQPSTFHFLRLILIFGRFFLGPKNPREVIRCVYILSQRRPNIIIIYYHVKGGMEYGRQQSPTKSEHSQLRYWTRKNNQLSESSVYPDAETLKPTKYVYYFTANHARILFRVRSRIADMKELQEYKCGDNNISRSCGASQETLQHVFNFCSGLKFDTCDLRNVFSDEMKVLKKVVLRVEEFLTRIEKKEDGNFN